MTMVSLCLVTMTIAVFCLMESLRQDRHTKGATQQWWTFTHATMLQLFGALSVLREEGGWERLKKGTLDVVTRVQQLRGSLLVVVDYSSLTCL